MLAVFLVPMGHLPARGDVESLDKTRSQLKETKAESLKGDRASRPETGKQRSTKAFEKSGDPKGSDPRVRRSRTLDSGWKLQNEGPASSGRPLGVSNEIPAEEVPQAPVVGEEENVTPYQDLLDKAKYYIRNGVSNLKKTAEFTQRRGGGRIAVMIAAPAILFLGLMIAGAVKLFAKGDLKDQKEQVDIIAKTGIAITTQAGALIAGAKTTPDAVVKTVKEATRDNRDRIREDLKGKAGEYVDGEGE